MKIIFVAKFKYGTARLVKCTVVKECPKTFQVSERTELVGEFYGYFTRVHKENHHWFTSKKEALAWLIQRAQTYERQLARGLETARMQVWQLEDLLRQAGAHESHACTPTKIVGSGWWVW